MDLWQLHREPKAIFNFEHRVSVSPAIAYRQLVFDQYSLVNTVRNVLAETSISKSDYYSFWYAHDILKGRFLEGETTLANSSDFAYSYAANVIKGRFLKGETAIAQNPLESLNYARYIIKGRFKLGEPTILNSSSKDNYETFIKSLA